MTDTTDGFPFKDAVLGLRYAATKVIAGFHFRKHINYDSAGNEVIGTKTDAKSTATDTTSVSAMSVWKQISASVQAAATSVALQVFGAGTAAASQRVTLASDDPAVATLGATTGTKVVTDANGTIQQYLRGLVTFFANALGAGTAAAAIRHTLASDDPAVATLGATTGTKVVTDANGTIQQYLRGLVTFFANALGAGTAAAAIRHTLASDDPAVATLGATTGTKVVTDANGTIQQYLRGLVTFFANALGTGTMAAAARVTIATDDAVATNIAALAAPGGYSAAVTLTRTADTNSYLANDVLGAATGSTAALTFANMGASGKEIMITSVAMEIDAASVISGQTSYRLYLYNVTPPSALGDNVAWDLPSGDRASYLGYVDLGTPVDLGSTLYVEVNSVNKQLKLSGTSLFGYLVTNGAYQPASATVHVITLHSMDL